MRGAGLSFMVRHWGADTAAAIDRRIATNALLRTPVARCMATNQFKHAVQLEQSQLDPQHERSHALQVPSRHPPQGGAEQAFAVPMLLDMTGTNSARNIMSPR